MRFVETSVFTAQIVDAIDDESYRQLQVALILRPEQGALIKGSGGLRKIRWSVPGQGPRTSYERCDDSSNRSSNEGC